MQKIAIGLGADHRGYALKELLKLHPVMGEYMITWHDVGAFSAERSDYPVYAKQVVEQLKKHEVELGILLCGSGTGMAIAANRYSGIYAGVAWDVQSARRGREDDNVNMLVVPADFIISEAPLIALVEAWLGASFKHGRYAERLKQIDEQ